VSHGARSRRLGLFSFAGLICLVAAISAPLARADVAPPSVPGCGTQTFSQPFLRFGDPAWYVAVPRGSFESGLNAWTLLGRTDITKDNEPWHVNSSKDKRSLGLLPGSSVTTAPVCVSLLHPTVRFFARGFAFSAPAALSVNVLYRDALGRAQSLNVGTVLPTGFWGATGPMILVANVLAALPGDHTSVRFQFVPQGASAWQIDDVYVDPYRKG
jgi:hypothetical protein